METFTFEIEASELVALDDEIRQAIEAQLSGAGMTDLELFLVSERDRVRARLSIEAESREAAVTQLRAILELERLKALAGGAWTIISEPGLD